MMMAVPWNKLYRTDYIQKKGILFPNIKWDDLHFNMEVIRDIESVAISSSSGYHFFRSRQGSETTIVFDGMLYKKRKEQFEHILDVYEHWNTEDSTIMSVVYGYYSSRLVQCVQEIAISDIENKRKLIKEILTDKLSKVAIKKGVICSRLLAVAVTPMKLGNVTGCIVVGKCIGIFKKKMPSLFYKLKSIYVNKASQL